MHLIVISNVYRTAFERIPQREPCQHTSCEACRFKVSPECPPCPVPVKKRCLRYFEMCLSEHYARDDIILVRLYCTCMTNLIVMPMNIFMKPYKRVGRRMGSGNSGQCCLPAYTNYACPLVF